MIYKHDSGTEGKNQSILTIKSIIKNDVGFYDHLVVEGAFYSCDYKSIKQKDIFKFVDNDVLELIPPPPIDSMDLLAERCRPILFTAKSECVSNFYRITVISFLELFSDYYINNRIRLLNKPIECGMKIMCIGDYEINLVK